MRAVEIMREELARRGLFGRIHPADCRKLASAAKDAKKRGSNPRAAVQLALNAIRK